MKMNEHKLKEYANILNALPEAVKNNKLDMNSTKAPTCNTPGCHAGLICIVAKYLPELRECYKYTPDFDGETYYQEYSTIHLYSYGRWADALALYLGFPFNGMEHTSEALMRWAKDNPYYWNNPYGDGMFNSRLAFGQDTDIFPHSVIIDHFNDMSDRLNKK